MKLLICIDDTDNLESKGTGAIASEMVSIIEQEGWGRCGFISRHQLLLHKDVKYTSHNSSMCFPAEIDKTYFETLKVRLTAHLEAEMAEGSDPGICVADLSLPSMADDAGLRERFVEFGYRAKAEVLNKSMAYDLAVELGLYLEETGGTGDGVIGALAGAALRLHGNDGEVKGGIDSLKACEIYRVEELLKTGRIDRVCTEAMEDLPLKDRVEISWKAKPVVHRGGPVLLVLPAGEDGHWKTMYKNEMRNFGDRRALRKACGHFRADVPEELISTEGDNCYNCIYRRWTGESIECSKSPVPSGR
jgi:hypothetical protein